MKTWFSLNQAAVVIFILISGHNLHREYNYMFNIQAQFLIQSGARQSHSMFIVSSIDLIQSHT